MRAMFSGKTDGGKHAKKKDNRTEVYFAPDGNAYKAKRLDQRDSSEGKWYANDENLLCMEKGGHTRCRRVVDKNGKIKKYKGTNLVWNYTKFKDVKLRWAMLERLICVAAFQGRFLLLQ